MLTSQPCGPIAASCSAPTRAFVAAVAGAASTTWSAAAKTSPTRSAGSVRAAPSTGRPRRVTARTSAPSPRRAGIIAEPIPPAPTIATVAIGGAGGIGSAMIPALRGLGAEVLAVTRRGLPVEGAARTLPADRVDEVFAAADHVVLAAPATAATRALVGAEQLAALGAQGWLVNIARGSLVDTDALVAALAAGTIAGAALDVTDPEPLPDGHPLWSEPRCIVTPHSTNPTPLRDAALAERVTENVRRFAAGEDLLGPVDPERGY